MIQQINLYQDSGKSDRHALLNPYLLPIFVTCLGLTVISGLKLQTIDQSETIRLQLQDQVRQSQARLQSLQAQYPNQQTDNLLNQELEQSQNLYQSLSHLMELLADDQSDRSRGFSDYLSALADQADNSVWLTGIEIDTTSKDITLQGSAFKAEQIAALLTRLRNTTAFKGRHFARLSIRQSPQSAEQIDFSVSSSQETEKEVAHARKP